MQSCCRLPGMKIILRHLVQEGRISLVKITRVCDKLQLSVCASRGPVLLKTQAAVSQPAAWCSVPREKGSKPFSGRARLKKIGSGASVPLLNGSIHLASFSIISPIPSDDSVFCFVCLLFKKAKKHKTLKTPICWKYTRDSL